MSTPITGEPGRSNLTNAEPAAANRSQPPTGGSDGVLINQSVSAERVIPPKVQEANLAPLFTAEAAGEFRSRWDVVQRGFVDDPKAAVRAGDELVAHVIKSLAETFSGQRAAIEGDQGQTSTENLRLALQRYRSFFERLLSV